MRYCIRFHYLSPSPTASNPETAFVDVQAKSEAEAKRKAKQIIERKDPSERWTFAGFASDE